MGADAVDGLPLPAGAPVASEFARLVADIRAGRTSPDHAARTLLARLDDAERLWLLDGDTPLWRGVREMSRAYNAEPIVAGAVPRLGIPGIRFSDGPRGVVMGRSTSFPVAIARAATWDVDLERRVGEAIGAEARAQGATLFAGVCVNLLRHPGWGRAQECYGEDPVLTAAMGVAATRGVRRHVMACVKHFACNSIEESRFVVDVEVDEATLHEVYLPHFRAVVDAGADAVMSAYNSVDGEWAGQNRALLTGVLRDEWRFDGFVMTDFVWGLRDPVASLSAGQDLEMPFRQQRARALPSALRDGRLPLADVDRSCLRLLAAQLRHAATLEAAPSPDVVAGDAHRALAREVAVRAAVLLRNEPVDGAPVLPLDPVSAGRVAVLGRLADAANLGDVGSSQVRPPSTCSIAAGLREALGADRVVHRDGADPGAAVAAARACGTAVVVVGLTPADEGEATLALAPEAVALLGPPLDRPLVASAVSRLLAGGALRDRRGGGDRRDLGLDNDQVALVRAVAAANPRTVVVLVGGSAITMEPWRGDVPAILLAWYPGMEGGRAVADVLLGDVEPGGRLPFVIPVDAAHLPPFDPAARRVRYDRWWGQRRLDRDGRDPAYPLGFGLGYTTFELTRLELDRDDDGSVAGVVSLRNTGRRRGATVVQLYAQDRTAAARVRRLCGFLRVEADPGESREARVPVDLGPVSRREGPGRWPREPGEWHLVAGQHARDDSGPAPVPLPVPWRGTPGARPRGRRLA